MILLREILLQELYQNEHAHFQEMTNGQINITELVAALICRKDSYVEGIQCVQERVDGSMTFLLMTKEGLYAARDQFGRTPLVVGKKKEGFCVSFESHAFFNLGYKPYKELGPGEIVYITPEEVTVLKEPGDKMKICSFLWVYYGYPTSNYEGVNVEQMRYRCGGMLAKRDEGKFMLSRTPSGRWSAAETNSARKVTRPSVAATRRVVPCPSCTSREPFRIQAAVPVFALGNLLSRSARDKEVPCQPSAYKVGNRASPVSPKVTCPSRVSFASMSARTPQTAAQMAANANKLVVFMVFLSALRHRTRRCHLILKS